jgi:surface antigen Omp85-like protein
VPQKAALGGRCTLAPFVLRRERLPNFSSIATARRPWPAALGCIVAFAGWLGVCHPCRAAEDGQPQAAESSPSKDIQEPETEFTIVPFVGGNSDMGFGGGYIASLARMEPNLDPYRYRLETAGTMTVGGADGGGLRIPYADIYLLISFPNIVRKHLGFELRASYTLEANLKYYGLGNASTIDPSFEPTDSYFEHSRTHPTVRATFEYRAKPFAVTWGASYTQNWFDIPDDTLLANEMASPDPEVRSLLGEATTHGSPRFSIGVAYDTRDDRTSPVRGLYVTQELDVTPTTIGGDVDYRFARTDTAVCFFLPIVPRDRRLVFAMRLAGDLLFGDPPFYELPRFEDTFAIGGAKGVRGVPGQRYYGKIKAFSNVELRSELFKAKILGDERRFGIVGFADFGRLWADYSSHPELDGTGVGLKYGIGGGLRVASGETFVLRIDVAWSPDANPIGGYLLAGHIF